MEEMEVEITFRGFIEPNMLGREWDRAWNSVVSWGLDPLTRAVFDPAITTFHDETGGVQK